MKRRAELYRPRSKRTEPTGPSQAEIRRAKDFWVEVLQDVIVAQIDESSAGKVKAHEAVQFAGDVADEALRLMEERWGKI